MNRPLPHSSRVNAAWTIVALSLLIGRGVMAQSSQSKETKVQALFLYNFGKFVDWPPKSFPKDDSPLKIVVLGDKALATALEGAIKKGRVRGRGFVIESRDDPNSARRPVSSRKVSAWRAGSSGSSVRSSRSSSSSATASCSRSSGPQGSPASALLRPRSRSGERLRAPDKFFVIVLQSVPGTGLPGA